MSSYGLRSLTVDLIANTASFESGLSKAERAIIKTERGIAQMVERIDPVTAKINNLDTAFENLTRQFEAGTIDKSKFELYSKQVSDFKRQVETSQYDKLLNQLDPVRAELSSIADQQARLKTGFDKGLINDADFNRYNKSLEQMRTNLTSNNAALNKNAMSSKQMAFAMRGLPAQFTDIAVSLQAGQNPMTVLLQQGGQLKDMFGGIGPAAKAMGTYIVGLLNPYSLAIASAAALTVAYYQGSAEADEFRKALVLTGNAAGTTSGLMADSAKRISQYSGTQHQAAAALAEVANTGKFVGAQLEQVAGMAVLMQNTTGKAVSETIDEYVKLAKDPAKAAAELNEKYNFLTYAVYEQIAALEKQGKTTDAAKLALETYSDAIKERTGIIEENLGYVEQAWKSIKNAAAGAWDAIRDIGRDDTLGDQLAEIEQKIAASEKRLSGGFRGPDGRSNEVKRLQELLAQRDALNADFYYEQDNATDDGISKKNERDAITARTSLNKVIEDGLSTEEKHVKALAEMYRWVEAIKKAAPNDVIVSDEAVAKYKKTIDDQFKDHGSDAGERLLKQYKQQEEQLRAQLEHREELTEQSKNLLKLNQQITDLKNKKELTAEEKSLLASSKKNKAQLELNKSLEDQLATQQRISREAAYQSNLSKETLAMQQQYADELAAFGTGDSNRQRVAGRNTIIRSIQSKRDKLTDQLNEKSIQQPEYDNESQKLDEELKTRLELYDKYYSDLEDARGNWENGASTAFQNYIDSAKDIASQTESLFTNAFSGMEDAIVQFATTGKLSFSNFTQSILSDLARIAAKQAIVNFLSYMVGSYFSSGTSYDNTGTVGSLDYQDSLTSTAGYRYSWSGGYTGDGGKYQAAGIVHKGEVVFSQEDVARNGGVASVERIRKGYKGYADGGVVGGNYAAVTPTTGGNSVSITQQINVSGNNSDSSVDSAKVTAAYAKAARDGAKAEIAEQLKAGGMIWRASRGY